MRTLEWLPDALDDLRRLHEFVAPHSQAAAHRLIDAILDAAESLKEFPEKGKPNEPDLHFRELLVPFGARGYVLTYRLTGEKIVIVRIWHASEDRGP